MLADGERRRDQPPAYELPGDAQPFEDFERTGVHDGGAGGVRRLGVPVEHEDVGATGAKDMGKVIGLVKPQVAGRADMGQVSALVRRKLGA